MLLRIGSPLEQFEIVDMVGIVFGENYVTYAIVNSVLLYVWLSFILIILLLVVCRNEGRIISNEWMIMMESIYFTIYNMVLSQIGKKGEKYFPMIMVLFLIILFCNLLSNVTLSYAATSHLIFTIGLSFAIFFGVTIISIEGHGNKFFSLFCPTGTPLVLVPLLVLIEGVSYVARGVSLGLRLGANIMAGHMLMVILGGFIAEILSGGFFLFYLGLIPLSIFVGISALEMAISIIQAYVFVILTCSYIKDAIELH